MVCIILDSPKREDGDSDTETSSKQNVDGDQDLNVQRIAGGNVVKHPPVFSTPSGEWVLPWMCTEPPNGVNSIICVTNSLQNFVYHLGEEYPRIQHYHWRMDTRFGRTECGYCRSSVWSTQSETVVRLHRRRWNFQLEVEIGRDQQSCSIEFRAGQCVGGIFFVVGNEGQAFVCIDYMATTQRQQSR